MQPVNKSPRVPFYLSKEHRNQQLAGNFIIHLQPYLRAIAATLLGFVLAAQTGFSQPLPEKGVPPLQNYAPAEYQHQGKIWDIEAAPNGMVYMAADKGMLEYDGNEWKSFKGSKGITRAVLVESDSLIFTGSDRDFGVWKRDKYMEFEYRSLYPFKDDLTDINEEFWSVLSIDDTIFFISADNIYVYENENLTKIPAPDTIESSFVENGVLYFADSSQGFFKLEDLSPKKIFDLREDEPIEIIGIFETDEGLTLVTTNNGLYRYTSGRLTPLENQLSRKLRTANAFSFDTIGDTHLAFGTILEGVFISDLEGRIVHYINKNKGLQNNTILSLHYSPAGTLWLGMDYGVSRMDLSSEFTFFYDYRGNFGTGNSAVLTDNSEFYLGTNQGLYRSDWDDLNNESELYDFTLVPNTEGQVWTLETIDNQLWIGHDNGLFVLEDEELNQIGNGRGVWTIQPYRDVLLAGTYNGIYILEKREGEWRYTKQMELILGSSNQIIPDTNDDDLLWINIPNFGVIQATVDENLYPVNREIFLSSEFSGSEHYIRKGKNGIEVVTDNYTYEYNRATNEFNEKMRSVNKHQLEDQLVRNAESALLNEQYEFFPVYNGFALKNLSMDTNRDESSYNLVLRTIQAFTNEERRDFNNGAAIPYNFDNLNIRSIVPNQDDVQYQYTTADQDEWSEWSSDGTIELIGLEYGLHIISVRAMVDGVTTPILQISFRLNTPWYLTWYAYLFYFLLLLLMIYLLYVWQGITLDRQKKYLLSVQRNYLNEQKQRHKQQLQRVEEQKLQAEYEQVKAQLKSKTIELATKAKENDEKNKILKTLKEKFEKLADNPESLKRRTAEIKSILDSHINSEDNTFEIQIDELHQEFFESLRADYPELTRYDLRLCAYIKIGFDSKEISDMLNIKPSSVYISRSRLRKKLGIDSDEDLHNFLNSV
jgi:DNA-binding CsgD family transcriptional regulator